MTDFNPLDYRLLGEDPMRTSIFSAWNEHLPFAMMLIELLRPRKFVELGTHAGISYATFCQAIIKLNVECRAYAVDTWQGDTDTGPYGSNVFEEFSRYHQRYNSFSTMLRMTFDEALSHVEDQSVDLLHIDGLHTYEAVRHDFKTWQSKVSDRGVVLFHDTAETQPGFGVKRFWAEVSVGRPAFEFEHGHGLGVLGVGRNLPPAMSDFFAATREKPEAVRSLFANLGRRIQLDVHANASAKELSRLRSIGDAKVYADARAQGRVVGPLMSHFAVRLRRRLGRIKRAFA